jgi:cytochrome c551/c552
MRLRLSDAATFAVLAEHYRAATCHQMARVTVSPFKEGWVELAAEWAKLAQETEAKAELERR